MTEVIWSARAKRAHSQIIAYLAERGDLPAGARVGRRIFEAGNALGNYQTGRKGRVAGTYEKSLPDINYILQYKINRRAGKERVVILDVVHGRRNWSGNES